ncbi:hypothetical protein HN51_003166 [Arachis hypogaea]
MPSNDIDNMSKGCPANKNLKGRRQYKTLIFGIAMILLITGTSMSKRQPYRIGWLNGECYLVKRGVYASSTILILVTVSSVIGSVLLTIKANQTEQDRKIHAQSGELMTFDVFRHIYVAKIFKAMSDGKIHIVNEMGFRDLRNIPVLNLSHALQMELVRRYDPESDCLESSITSIKIGKDLGLTSIALTQVDQQQIETAESVVVNQVSIEGTLKDQIDAVESLAKANQADITAELLMFENIAMEKDLDLSCPSFDLGIDTHSSTEKVALTQVDQHE